MFDNVPRDYVIMLLTSCKSSCTLNNGDLQLTFRKFKAVAYQFVSCCRPKASVDTTFLEAVHNMAPPFPHFLFLAFLTKFGWSFFNLYRSKRYLLDRLGLKCRLKADQKS